MILCGHECKTGPCGRPNGHDGRHYPAPVRNALIGVDWTFAGVSSKSLTTQHSARQKRYREEHPDYNEREAQRHEHGWSYTKITAPFAGVDFEGAPGRVKRKDLAPLVLLRAGADMLTEETGKGISWQQGLDWLCHRPQGFEYVAYAFGYDVGALLASYPIDMKWLQELRDGKPLRDRTGSLAENGITLTREQVHKFEILAENRPNDLRKLGKTGRVIIGEATSSVIGNDEAALFGENSGRGWYIEWWQRKHFTVCPMRVCPDAPSGWCYPSATGMNDNGNRLGDCGYCGREPDPSRGHRFTVTDVFTNFQAPFTDSITKWGTGTAEEREKIATGKDTREDIKFYNPAEILGTVEYNRLECEHLADLMTKFREAWHDTGLGYPRTWAGPAPLSKKMFAKYQAPKRDELDKRGHVPAAVWELAEKSRFGGWFEVPSFGPVPGPVTEYDLTSAYPEAFTHLPCLRHHCWERREPRRGEYALQYVLAGYDGPVRQIGYEQGDLLAAVREGKPAGYKIFAPDWRDDPIAPRFMGLPHRDTDGRISRPLATEGWYWNFEIREARHQTVTVTDSWVMVDDGPCKCKYRTERMIQELFRRRQMLGKGRGKPLKLALNAAYGILAEMQRGDRQPPYVNPIAASFITAWVRALIMRLIHEQTCEQGLACGHGVVMIATDAVFLSGMPRDSIPSVPVEEKEKAQLGEWTREQFRNGLFIVQGGVYWELGSRDEAKSKTRGVPASILQPHIDDFEKAYRRMIQDKDIDSGVVTLSKRRRADGKLVDAVRFVGITEAAHRNAWDELGTFQPYTRKIGFDWTSKRALPEDTETGPDEPLMTWPKSVTDPVSNARKDATTTFADMVIPKHFGEDNKLDLIDDTPDWLPALDGTPDDEGFSIHADE